MSRFSYTNPNILIMALTLVLLFYVIAVANRAIAFSGEHNRKTKKGWTIFLTGYLVYVLVICLLCINGFFDKPPIPPRLMVLFIPVIMLITWLGIKKIAVDLFFLQKLAPHFFIAIQAYRIGVELILDLLHKEGTVPVQLTYHGWNFDIIIGGLALVVTWLLSTKPSAGIRLGIIWNIAGLISLINILTIAVRSVPGPVFVLQQNLLPSYFPGILIPAVFVTLAILFHVVSLKQLLFLNNRREKG